MKLLLPKKIENALKNMIQAISACPGSVGEILALIDQIKKDEIRVDEVVEAIIDPNEVLLNELGLSHLEMVRQKMTLPVSQTMPMTTKKTKKMLQVVTWKGRI